MKDMVHLQGATYTVPEDYVAPLRNVYFCPQNSALLTRDREFVLESVNTTTSFYRNWRPILASEFERAEYIPGYSTPLRGRFNNYYHTLVDNLPRIAALNCPALEHIGEIRVLYRAPLSRAEEFFFERLAPSNVHLLEIEAGRIYELEHALFTPFKSRDGAGYLSRRYIEAFVEACRPKRVSKANRRIYITRRGVDRRRRNLTNEGETIDLLESLGFERCALEDLSQQQQIDLFYDAEIVVGAHGAGLTNLLFSPHAKVVELFPTQKIRPHYLYLSMSLGHDYQHLCGNERSWNAEYRLGLPALREALAKFGLRDLSK